MTVEKWAEDFKGYINELELFRDDYNGIMEFIDEGANILKEQKAVEPRRDANRAWVFRCGACGERVGFINLDPGDPNEQDNYCRNCGRPVKWE